MQVNILEAKNQLSKLVQAVLDGEEVVIAKNGTPVVRLVKVSDRPRTTGFGAWSHLPPPAEDWDSPETNAAIAKACWDGPLFPPSRPGPAAKKKAATKPTRKTARR